MQHENVVCSSSIHFLRQTWLQSHSHVECILSVNLTKTSNTIHVYQTVLILISNYRSRAYRRRAKIAAESPTLPFAAHARCDGVATQERRGLGAGVQGQTEPQQPLQRNGTGQQIHDQSRRRKSKMGFAGLKYFHRLHILRNIQIVKKKIIIGLSASITFKIVNQSK